MQDLGDKAVGDTVYFKFNTILNGVMTSLVGGTISIYYNENTTPVTTGVTLVTDFNSKTGLNHVTVVCTDAWYATGQAYFAVLTAGTISGISIVGMVVAFWTIGKGGAYARLGAPAGASIEADIAAVKSDSAAIKAKTDALPAIYEAP